MKLIEKALRVPVWEKACCASKRSKKKEKVGAAWRWGEVDKACWAPEVRTPTHQAHRNACACESPGGCVVVCGASCSANTVALTWEGAYNVGGLDTKHGIMWYHFFLLCASGETLCGAVISLQMNFSPRKKWLWCCHKNLSNKQTLRLDRRHHPSFNYLCSDLHRFHFYCLLIAFTQISVCFAVETCVPCWGFSVCQSLRIRLPYCHPEH